MDDVTDRIHLLVLNSHASFKPECDETMEDIAVAETTKLPVGQVLDKLRSADAPISKSTQREQKIEALDEELQRVRAARLRLERDQRAGPTQRK